jgi:enamine deaminase RidA (YjgF/YER057c/UK114 family)
VFVSGQLPFENGQLRHKGIVGAGVSVEDAQAAARLCALNLIAQVRTAVGDLDMVARVIKLGGFVASAPNFTDQSKVVNGASDRMVEVFGDLGRHARAAVGVAALPLGVSVEIDGVFETF